MAHQEITFYDWLSGQSSYRSHPGALLVHPVDQAASKVVMSLLRNLDRDTDQRIAVVTTGIPGLAEEYPNVTIINYEDTEQLAEAADTDTWIIIDSLSSAVTMRTFHNLENIHSGCRLIILTTLGVSSDDLKALNESIDDDRPMHIFHLALPSNNLRFELEQVRMTPEQSAIYDTTRAEEIDAAETGTGEDQRIARNRVFTRGVTNFIYPEGRGRDPDALADQGGWISQQEITNLADHPKLFRLISVIIDRYNSGAKQIVFSQYVDQYGLKLISALLTLVGVEHILYTPHQQPEGDWMTQFNESTNGIILTSRLAFYTKPRNVTDIHLVDQYTTSLIEGFLRLVYRAELYDSEDVTLTIRSYVALMHDGDMTTSMQEYLKMAKEINEGIQLYNKLTSTAVPIVEREGEFYLTVATQQVPSPPPEDIDEYEYYYFWEFGFDIKNEDDLRTARNWYDEHFNYGVEDGEDRGDITDKRVRTRTFIPQGDDDYEAWAYYKDRGYDIRDRYDDRTATIWEMNNATVRRRLNFDDEDDN